MREEMQIANRISEREFYNGEARKK